MNEKACVVFKKRTSGAVGGWVMEIKTSFQFLYFIEKEKKPKTSTWSCKTRDGVELGIVKWYSAWRQYCFFSSVQAVYSAGCLTDIAEFCRQLNSIQRKEWQGRAAESKGGG
jgi:hypothetical protein